MPTLSTSLFHFKRGIFALLAERRISGKVVKFLKFLLGKNPTSWNLGGVLALPSPETTVDSAQDHCEGPQNSGHFVVPVSGAVDGAEAVPPSNCCQEGNGVATEQNVRNRELGRALVTDVSMPL